MNCRRHEWRERAARLAGRVGRERLHRAAVLWLEEHGRTERLAVACSGGADSLALLLLIWAHWPEARRDLLVLHFDHRLRGKESAADAEFVAEVAEGLGVEARIGRWERTEDSAVSEERAREARFDFFAEVFVESGRRALLLGHQRDDIVETQLMRLSRGSGTAGLAAPRPVHVFRNGRTHVRPLLAISGTEIRRELAAAGIPFRVDATNAGGDFYRNRLRREVLPVWEKAARRDVAAGAAASRELLEEDEVALRAWLREIVPGPRAGEEYDLRNLAGKPRALFRRALRDWLTEEGILLAGTAGAFSRLLRELESGGESRISVGKSDWAEVAGRKLRRIRAEERVFAEFREPWPLVEGGEILLAGGRGISAAILALDEDLRERILKGMVDARRMAFVRWREGDRFRVRNWRAGDRYRPLGAPGRKKLQDIFVDRKICEAERHLLPVVLCGEEIVWTPFLPPAESIRINPGVNRVVQLTYDWGHSV